MKIDPQLLRSEVMTDVNKERDRQDKKYGHHIKKEMWLAAIGEEHGEVCQAYQFGEFWSKEADASDLYTELIHLAAITVKVAEQVKEKRLIEKGIDYYA